MAKQLFTNNAKARLNAAITGASGTIPLQAGQGALFPNPSGGDWFMATLINTSGQVEIVKVTARSVDTLTVDRAQEGTLALSFAVNDRLELRWTAGGIELLRDNLWAPQSTRMVFNQTSAPTYWTKSTDPSYDDAMLRIVTGSVGSGGATAFSALALASVGGHAITQAELPNCNFIVIDPGHQHNQPHGVTAETGGAASGTIVSVHGLNVLTDLAATGITVSSGGSDTPHTHPLGIDPKFHDVVLGQKD